MTFPNTIHIARQPMGFVFGWQDSLLEKYAEGILQLLHRPSLPLAQANIFFELMCVVVPIFHPNRLLNC